MALEAYRFCPRCMAPLRSGRDGSVHYRFCPQCEFRIYAEPKVAVVARIERAGTVLLVRRAIEPGQGLWSLPGGFLNVDETPAQALRREVREETAVDIEPADLLGVFPMEGRGSGIPGIVLAYGAVCLSDPQTVLAGDDAADAQWCRPEHPPGPLAFAATRQLLALRPTHAPQEGFGVRRPTPRRNGYPQAG